MQGDVLASGAVALFADDAENQAGLAVTVDRRRHPFEIAGVTLEAAGDDVFVEVRRSVGIAGAVHPAVGFIPVGDGELEQQVALPEEIALSFARLTGDDVDALGAGDGLARARIFNRALVVAVGSFRHFEMQIRVGGMKDIRAGRKTTFDRAGTWPACCEVMGGLNVRLGFSFVTGGAGAISDVFGAWRGLVRGRRGGRVKRLTAFVGSPQQYK